MQTAMLLVLLYSLAIRQCLAAVTWHMIGCTNWNFEGTSIDTIWDNAVQFTTQAQSQIDLIPAPLIPKSQTPAEKIAGGNAHLVFDVNFRDHRGLDSAGKRTMRTVRSMYDDVRAGLQGTLANEEINFDLENAYLLCGSDTGVEGVTRTPIPGKAGNNEWHADISSDGEEKYLALAYKGANTDLPCNETADYYNAKTFRAEKWNGQGEREIYVAIILCPNQFARHGSPVRPTLDLGYTAVAAENNELPYVGQYASLAGTLLHEMVHVVGRSRGVQWEDPALGLMAVNDLAKTSSALNLINPDTYRVFAEMSMSPGTRWGQTYTPPSAGTTITAAS